jgi:hypothetical protein
VKAQGCLTIRGFPQSYTNDNRLESHDEMFSAQVVGYGQDDFITIGFSMFWNGGWAVE